MIFRNSLKNIIRSRGKTTLFFLLLLSITIVLCLGLGIWVSINQFLAECNDNYTTIALLEYMGPEYPDEYVYDTGMNEAIDKIDFSQIENNENTILWDRSKRALGYIEGFERKDVYAPQKNSSVIIVNDIGYWNSYKANSAVIAQTLHSNYNGTRNMVLIETFDFELEKGHTYVINGEFGYGATSYPYFWPGYFKNASAISDGHTEDKYRIEDITNKDESYTLDPDSIFVKIARTYNVINNSISLNAVNDLSAVLQFHQQMLYMKEGRGFTEEEYSNSEKVCIITDYIAKFCDFNIGDEIPISIAIKEDTPVYESYWDSTGFSHEDTYKIVGITNSTPELLSNVYIPDNESLGLTVNQIGYTLGQVVLDNEGADDFYNEISPILPDRVRLTIYDQGYSSVVEPFKKILRIAIIITITCMLVGLSVIILFGFLFVYRQREVADTMIKLGTGKWRTSRYFIFGSGIIALFAAAAGTAAGFLLSGITVKLVQENAENFIVTSKLYSISNLSIMKVTEWSSKINPSVLIWTGIGVLVLSILSCLGFTLATFRKKNKKNKRVRKIKRTGHSVSFTGGAIKYSVISIMRGNQRSIITPIVALTIVLFLSQLASTSDKYQKQLEDIYTNTIIDAHFTDINGRYFNDLSVEAYQLNGLKQSGLISDLVMTKFMIYKYLGKSVVNGEPQEVDHLIFPKGYPGETFFDKILRGPRIIFTNSINDAPEFYFSSSVETEYLEGYDETSLTLKKNDVPYCMVSTDFMIENDVKLGDSIRIFVQYTRDLESNILYEHKKFGVEIDVKVIGSYVKEGEKDNIYCQLATYYNQELLNNPSQKIKEQNFQYVFDSANFKINAENIDEAKTFMVEYGFSEVNHINMVRAFILCDDKSFNSTVDSLNQKIRHTKTLYPFLYTLVGIVALLLAYLLAVSRKKEIATMRGLGAKKNRIFMTFFTEQVILSLFGCGLGLALWRIFSGRLILNQILLAIGFIGCYFIGSAIALTIMNNSVVLSILNDEE